jgi:hypothetical protein
MFRTISLSIILILQIKASSQNTDSLCKTIEPAPIRAYFEGYLYKYETESGSEFFRMERTYFQKNFRLSLSDTSYRIVRFAFTTNMDNNDLLRVIGNNEGIIIDQDNYTRLLRKMTKHSMITVDDIIVIKNSKCYKVPSFICYFINR